MNVFTGIRQFNEERKLHLRTFDAKAEKNMILLELDELMDAKDVDQQVDALCDVIVFAVGGLIKLKYSPEVALEETLKEILSRQGVIDPTTGKWEKSPTQDPATLYTANYDLAKE